VNRAEEARFRRLVKVDDNGCWLWQGTLSRNGYGRHRVGPGRGLEMAHRVSYAHYVGPIPEGLQIDHLCRVRSCTNPAHLEAVTASVNTERQDHDARRRTECPQGHPYDAENTIVRADGFRRCRECDRARKRQP
jgi:hypothetical protein